MERETGAKTPSNVPKVLFDFPMFVGPPSDNIETWLAFTESSRSVKELKRILLNTFRFFILPPTFWIDIHLINNKFWIGKQNKQFFFKSIHTLYRLSNPQDPSDSGRAIVRPSASEFALSMICVFLRQAWSGSWKISSFPLLWKKLILKKTFNWTSANTEMTSLNLINHVTCHICLKK
jgi:hypothetical protein